jgi:alkylation response protein AidB-like acyl-CoA dehydrogenase
VAQRVSGLSIEQMGGVGFTRELGIEKYWRFVFFLFNLLTSTATLKLEQFMKVTFTLFNPGSLFVGTSNIQMDTIFRNLQKQYGSS